MYFLYKKILKNKKVVFENIITCVTSEIGLTIINSHLKMYRGNFPMISAEKRWKKRLFF